MSQSHAISVFPAAPGSSESTGAFDLYRRHSGRLGFLPRGAWDEFATQGQVLVACIDGGVAGYLAYRVASRAVVIVHLCVDARDRGKGIARLLMNALVEAEPWAPTIRLSCRSDYHDANRLWPKLGFVCRTEKPGRGRAPSTLFYWVRQCHGVAPLYALLEEHAREGRQTVVLDANVFFDLDQDSARSDESKALLADWLQPDVALCVTAELFNEISRQPVAEVRERRRSQASRFQALEADPEAVRIAYEKVSGLLPRPRATADSDLSDRRQLAHAAAKEADFFVTRDEALLGCARALEETVGVQVVRPVDLLTRVHAENVPHGYAPARLVGTPVCERLVASEEEMLPFQLFARAEPKEIWLKKCRTALSNPHRYETKVVETDDGQCLVLLTVDRAQTQALTVVTFRSRSHPFTETLLRRVVAELLARSVARGTMRVEVGECHDARVLNALRELGFYPSGSHQVKLTIGTIAKSEDVPALIEQHGGPGPDSPFAIAPPDRERKLWPLKVEDGGADSFVVPVRPTWAAQLFDVDLANEDLFGAAPQVGLALENVYYSASPARMAPGTRILWYVSTGNGPRREVRQIRACSLCLETLRGPAREIFPRLSRLGVYRWPDVLRCAKGSAMGEVTAYRFGFTERFTRPIPWRRLQAVLSEHTGSGNPIAGPTRVSPEVFIELYREGSSRNG